MTAHKGTVSLLGGVSLDTVSILNGGEVPRPAIDGQHKLNRIFGDVLSLNAWFGHLLPYLCFVYVLCFLILCFLHICMPVYL